MKTDDKTRAINKIETRVCALANLHEGQTPEVLMRILFDDLRKALARGETASELLPRRNALERIHRITHETIAETTFRSAVMKIREALGRCRPDDPSLLGPDDVDEGVACIVENIGGTPHLVFVRGPYREHNVTMLVLEAEFRPLHALSRTDSPEEAFAEIAERAAVHRPVTLEPVVIREEATRLPTALPYEIDQNFREILRNMSTAEWISRANPHTRELIRGYLNDLVEKMRRASRLWAFGEIQEDYDDFSLLTGWVTKLHDGDELLALTNWDSDHDWWYTVDGRHFLNANELAIRQKAVIRRIFVHKKPEDPDLRAVRLAEMERHRAIGVDVRTISSSDPLSAGLMPELRSRCVLRARDEHDVLRGWVTYTVGANDEREGELLNVFSINPQVIKENERMLEGIWKNATDDDLRPITGESRLKD